MAQSRTSLDRPGLVALACASFAALAAMRTALPTAAEPVPGVSALLLGVCALGLAAHTLERRDWGIALGAAGLGAAAANLVPFALGWTPNPLAASLFPHWAPMEPHADLALGLMGAGLVMPGRGRNVRLRWVGAGVLGGAVTVLALTGLAAEPLDFRYSHAWRALARMGPTHQSGVGGE